MTDLGFDQTDRDAGVSFAPTITDRAGEVVTAWLQLADASAPSDGVDVWTTHGKLTDEPATRGNPLLLSTGGVAHLFWVEFDDWAIHHVTIDDGGLGERSVLPTRGRPHDLAGDATGGDLVVAWESVEGTRSTIRGRRCVDGEWAEEERISDPTIEAAHDVDVSLTPTGRTYAVYTAFADGWYEIRGRTRDETWSAPQTLSDQPSPAGYPTVATTDDGDAWVSWVHYQLPTRVAHTECDRMPIPFVTHERRRQQRSFFERGRLIVAHRWDGETVLTPEYDPDWEVSGIQQGDWGIARHLRTSGHVFHAYHGARPRLVVDGSGAVRLLWLDYPGEQERPVLTSAHLRGDRWSEPVSMDAPYGDAERIHTTVDAEGDVLVAAGRDERNPHQEVDDATSPDVGWTELPAVETADAPQFRTERRQSVTTPDLRNPRPDGRSIGPDDRELVFFNFHTHSDLSRCERSSDGEIELNLRHARDVMGERCTAVTDHGYNLDPMAQFKSDRAVRLFHHPGTFVVVPSQEFGTSATDDGHFGHVNVHWFDERPSYVSARSASGGVTIDEFRDAVSGSKTLALPHHTANAELYATERVYDDGESAPVAEIFQLRGSCETPNGPGTTEWPKIDDGTTYLQSQLARGRTIGFIGGGDHMDLGLGAAWVDGLSRESVYRALRERRCYATTGAATEIRFLVNGEPMGATTGGDSATIDLAVDSGVAIDTIQLLHNNEVVRDESVGHSTIERTWTETTPGDEHWLYGRIFLETGEIIWTSPVWVEGAASD